jgi:U3 small nucleolar RNA-associated protein 12
VQAADKTIEVFKSRNQDEIRKRVARLQKRAREKNPDAQPEEITVDSIVPQSILRCSSKIRSFDVSHVKGDAFSLLCALANNSVEVYKSVEEGDEPFKIVSTLELQGHRTDVRCVALSSDDELIASGSNGSIKVWNAATKQCIKTLVDCGYVLCLSFVPGNKHVSEKVFNILVDCRD